MSEIQLVDVTVHVDENLDASQRSEVDTAIRALDGVVSVHNPDDRSHLYVVEYNPAKTSSAAILASVQDCNIHAELVGL